MARGAIRLLLLLGLRHAALRCTDGMLRVLPGDSHALATRAHLLAQDGNLPDARRALQTLVERHPQQASAWFNLGYLCEAMGLPLEAEAAFRRAIGLRPALDLAWYGLGLSLIRQHRLDEAAEALRRTTELQPMGPHGWYQLARVQADRNDPAEASRIIRHLRGFEPRFAEQLVRETGLGEAGA